MNKKVKAAIIGPGNIGTDLLMKAMRSETIEPVWMVGVESDSPGLKRAREMGLKTSSDGVDGMLPTMQADGVQICFDATSAYVHAENSRKVNEQGAVMIDLTPAAIGPFCVPPVNLADAVAARAMNVNMVTCGGQATIPLVAAVSRVQAVAYGEIVATVSSKSAGPGTRKNIDEFTRTTASGIEKVGGAASGKAISAFDLCRFHALGADYVMAARAFMFSIGCIQARMCHTNRCPTGITTQDPLRQKAIDVAEKAQRVAAFHRNTMHAMAELLAASGLGHPGDLRPHHIHVRARDGQILRGEPRFIQMAQGTLLNGRVPDPYRQDWECAQAASFTGPQ